MEKLRELIVKTAKDAALQERYSKIIKEVETAGEDATKKKLMDFAKDAGYDITLEEMEMYYKTLTENMGELSDVELDMVAGGKYSGGSTNMRDIQA